MVYRLVDDSKYFLSIESIIIILRQRSCQKLSTIIVPREMHVNSRHLKDFNAVNFTLRAGRGEEMLCLSIIIMPKSETRMKKTFKSNVF